MQVTKYHSVGAYLINAILLINLLSPAFLPTYVMAQTITEEDEERIQQINKGQWDGALGVKNFTLPGLDNAPLTSTDPVTGEVVEHSYQQEDGSYNFSSIKMADMFQGFSQAQHEAYAADLEDIRDNPHQIQDSTYQMQLDKTTYADTECASLSSVDEQQRCELAKQALLLDDMRANEGADEFMGAGDSILTDFASIADGTNTYYSELQNEECVETLIEGEDGETSGLMNQHRCMVAAEDAEKVCEAERYVESTKVGEKVILSYSPPENDFDFINEFDSVSVRPCPYYEHDITSCLEFDVLTISDVDLVSTGITDTYKRLSGYIDFGGALYSGSKRLKHFAVRSDLVAPSMTLPSNLSTLMDDPASYISEFPLSAFNYEGGIQYHYEQIDECSPEDYYEGVCVVEEKFTDSLSGGSTSGQAFNNADVFRYQNYVDDLALTEPPIISGLEDIYTISPVEEPLLGPLLVPLGTFGLGFKPDPSQGEYDCSDGCWYAADRFYIHAYFPETIKSDYDVFDLLDGPNVSPPLTDFDIYSFHRFQIEFDNKVGMDSGPAPEPVDSSTTEVIKVIIDDNDIYPQSAMLNVLGAEVEVSVDVFDQGTYFVDQYFPTNIRVEGDTVESFTVKTIGRPTNRYEYELEIEFSGIAPFEVIADIHRIDETGFRPRVGEEGSCQALIDLYTSGRITEVSEITCDYQIADGDGSIRIFDSGAPIDWAHVGYFGFMPNWTPDDSDGLPNFCYDATINVDPSLFDGFSSIDRDVTCSGLEQPAYDACMNGEYCEYDATTGGTTCYEMGEDLKKSFSDSCAAYISDDSCSHIPNETRCEESINRDGETVCLYESHVFECTTETEFSTPGTGDSTEIDCGIPRNCINGECNNLADESNDAFLRASAAMQVLQEAKDNKCVVGSDGNIDESSCRLFAGKATRCKTPTVWGAMDCCNPDDLGMGGMDIVAYWQMAKLLDEIDERVNITGYMSQAWGAVQQTADGTALGNGMGAMSEYIQGVSDTASAFGSNAYSFVTKPIVAGWESTFKTLGFDPEGEVVGIAADYFDVGTAVAGNAGTAAETTRQSAEVLSNTAPQSAGLANATVEMVGEDEAIGGMYKYLAKGINNFLLENGYAETANAIFVTGTDGSIGFNTSSATGEFLNTAANIFGWIMLAYTIYNVYNLAVGIAFACDEEDFETTQKIKLLSTHYVGSWCSKKLFIGGCVEYSQGHCTFPSVFSRIISEEFRRIMAEDDGVGEKEIWMIDPTKKPKPENLACDGFTLDEVANIDWDRVDLSEYESIVLATLKYDPNNMPEDFTKSDYMVESDGPQAGQTLKQSGASQAAIVAHASEQARDHMNPSDLSAGDPDYMPWFEQGSAPESDNCLVSCDTASGFYYDSDASLCVSEAKVPYPADFTCDGSSGYSLIEESPNNFTCQRTQTVAPIAGCRDGFIVDELTGLCTKDTIWFEDKVTSCPSGYRLSAEKDSCDIVQTTPKVTNCTAYGPGFVLVDNVCQQTNTETAPPFLSCTTDDHIIEDGECILRTELPPTMGCTAPLQYDEGSESCVEVSYDSIPATFSCESYGPDYDLVNGNCIKRTVTTGTLTCDEGYSLVDGMCEKSFTGVFDATTTCPDTYMADPQDTSKCFKRVQTELRSDPYCEDSSFTLIDNSYCQKVISESLPPEPVCLNSYAYDEASELCVKVTRYPPTINCSSSDMVFDELSGLCRSITDESVPPTYACNEEDSLVDGQCITYDTAGYSLSCPDDYFYSVESNTCILQEVETQAPSYWCPIGTTKSGNQCLRYDYSEPSRSCEAPKTLNSETLMCEETVTLSNPPSVFCPSPSYKDPETGICMIDEVVPADAACPSVDGVPFVYNSETELCEREITVEEESVYICPPGEVECNTADEREPVPTCENGSVNPETGNCEDFIFTYPDAVALCNNMTHFYNSATNRCEYLETLSAVKCGPPLSPYFFYEPVSKTCQHENQVMPISSCIDGFVFDGTSCISTSHAPMTCSDPAMTFNTALDRCVKTTLVPAVVECQPPFVIDPNDPTQCRLPETHEPICSDNEFVPVGYDENTDTCRHLNDNAVHDAYLVCPAGSLNQDNQYCYSGNTEAASCPPSFSYNSVSDRCDFTPTVSLYCTGDTSLAADPVTGDMKCMYLEERRPVCPSSDQYYDIELNRCVQEEIVTGTMVCNDQPPFYRHLDGTQCMTVGRVPYESPGVCPDGYYPYSESLCEAELPAEPPEFNCPSGFQRNMASPEDTHSPRCVKYNETPVECDVGFNLDDNLCTKEHYDYEPIDQCIYNGQTLFGDACNSGIQQVAPICPDNYSYSAFFDTCIELTEESNSQNCLSDNFVLDSSTGQCNSIYEEPPLCLEGYTLNTVSNQCEQVFMEPVCDEENGFYYDNDLNICKKYETEPASFYCDPNERDDGDGCVPVEEPVCNPGWTFEPENDRCYRQDNQPYEPNCDAGEVDFAGECLEEVAVDCSVYGESAYWDSSTEQCLLPDTIPANPDGCGPQQVLIDDVCYDVTLPICPPEAPNYNNVSKMCEGIETSSAPPFCNPGEYDTGSGCTPQAEPTCASIGFVFVASLDSCQKSESFAKDYECDVGDVVGDECREIEPVNCPSGYTDPDNDGVCTERTVVPAESACDNGGEPPSCEEITEYEATCPSGYVSHDNETCSSSSETIEQPSCASGLIYDHSSNICTDLTDTEPTESCDNDADNDPSNGCTSVDTDDSKISCDTGWSFNSDSNKCEITADKTCNDGGILTSEGKCVSDRGFFQFCDEDKYPPAGVFLGDDDNCLYVHVTSSNLEIDELEGEDFTCEEEPTFGNGTFVCTKVEAQDTGCSFDVIDSQCVEVFPDAVCPSSFTSIDGTDSCYRDATPTCDDDFDWNGSTCENEYDNGTYTQTCPTGENLVDGMCVQPDAAYSCSDGFSLVDDFAGANNDRCVLTEVDYQSKECNSGGALQPDGMCRTVDTGNQYYYCDTGTLEEDQCAFYDDTPGCDTANGFVFHSATNDCRKYSSADLESCPVDWTDNGASCSRELSEPPLCATGYYYEASTDKCQLISDNPYEYDCGTGTHIGGGLCEEDVIVSPECLPGYTFFGSTNSCRADAGIAQTYSCPVATPSYTLDGQSCSREIPNPPYCPEGSYNSARGTCTFNHHEHNPNCESPFVDANGQCEHYMPEPPICSAANPNYNPVHKSCDGVKEDYNYECNVANGFTPVDGDITTCEKTTYETHQCPLVTQVLDTSDDNCKTYQYDTPSDQCEQLGFGSTRSGANCETYYDQGFVTCPSGFRVDYDLSKNNLVCHLEETQASTQFCPFNYINDGGVCVEVSTNDVDYSCPQEWSLIPTSDGFECQRFTDDVYPSYECTDPSSPLFDTEACRTEDSVVVGDIEYTCQGSGYVYNEEDHVCRLPAEGYAVNEYCADPTFTLVPLDPSEIEPNGKEYKCVNTYLDTVEPFLSCPDASPAFELRLTGNCVRSEPTTSLKTCGSGYDLSDDGTICTREVVEITPPDITCSEPYSATITGECVLTTTTTASQTCDPVDDATGECSMEIDGSIGSDQYGVFNTPMSLAGGTPFEISMMASCLEPGKPCVLLGNSDTSGDAIYIPPSAVTLNLIVDGIAYQYPLDGLSIEQDNHYQILRDTDNEVSVSVNGTLLDTQLIPSTFSFDWAFRHNGLGDHSKVLFNSAAIADYSDSPQRGHVYSMSCDGGSNIIEDINLDNDITIINMPFGGGTLTPFTGDAYGNNAPPLPITESDWNLVSGVCERISVIDEVPPTLTCDGEENADGECLSPVSYPPTPTCDTEAGFEYNSLTFSCERITVIEEAPESYTCDELSHVIYDGMCQYSEGILPEGEGCAEGYEYDEVTSSCSIYQIVTEQAVLCEDGDEQRFNLCFERQYIEPNLECPTNSVDIGGGQCEGTFIDRVNPNVTCSVGNVVGSECVETDVQAADVSCSDLSYELLNNVCYKDIILTTTPPSLTCLPNHTLEEDGLCHFESSTEPFVECPDVDYTYNSSTSLCEKIDTQNYHPDLGCPDDGLGWVSSSSSSCERVTSSIAVTRECEDPTADDSGEQCFFEREETHEPGFCQSPYILEGGQCNSYEYAQPEISCPTEDNIRQTANGCMEIIRTTQAPVTDC
jgi:hypothetical protein